MIRIPGFVTVLVLASIYTTNVFSMGGKPITVMKVHPVINIPDGEYLYYTSNYHGERGLDYYFVTRKVTNADGDMHYRIYFDIIDPEQPRKISGDYLNWPAYFDVDPKLGSVIESEGKLDLIDSKNWVKGSGLIYWHYKLMKEKGEVEYTARMVSGVETNESKYRVDVSAVIPSMSMWAGLAFIPRFLDVHGGGIYLTVIPDGIKTPMPTSWKCISTESIQTKAGSFKVNRYNFVLADPFINMLIGPFLKGSSTLVEDSERRLTVQSGLSGGVITIAVISNVNKK